MAAPTVARIDEPRIAPVGVGKGCAQAVRIGRHDDHMDMVRHQAVGPHPGSGCPGGVRQELAIGDEIILLEEGGSAPIAALGNMIGRAGYDEPGKTGQMGPPVRAELRLERLGRWAKQEIGMEPGYSVTVTVIPVTVIPP